MLWRAALFGFAALCIITRPVSADVILGQIDTFTTPDDVAGWQGDPFPPVWRRDGGPDGIGDHFLEVQGLGGTGPGSKPNIFNDVQWAGNYLSAGITQIQLDVNHLGGSQQVMQLRVGLEGPGVFAWSLDVEPIAPGTQPHWQHLAFDISPASLGGDATSVLDKVSKLWLYHSPLGGTPGDSPALDVSIGYDNVTGVPEPTSILLILAGGLILLSAYTRRRNR